MKKNGSFPLATMLTSFFPEAQPLLPFLYPSLDFSGCKAKGTKTVGRDLAILLARGCELRPKQFAQDSGTKENIEVPSTNQTLL